MEWEGLEVGSSDKHHCVVKCVKWSDSDTSGVVVMQDMPWKNKLFFGDNLDVLRQYVQDETVDLIYLDPPFNSNATYNVLFEEQSGEHSAAQITAFEDTWDWGIETRRVYEEVVREGPIIEALLR